MVSEPECRQVAIPGRARNSAKEALHRNAKQGGTASIFVALDFFKGDFYFCTGGRRIVLNAEC